MDLARKTLMVLRQPRMIFPDDLLRATLAAVCEGVAHFRGIAEQLSGLCESAPSRQALAKRLSHEAAPSFFCTVLQEALERQHRRLRDANGAMQRCYDKCQSLFGQLLIEDSTVAPLHGSLKDRFPGARNQHGEFAALRYRWAFDYFTGKVFVAVTHFWRANDMSTAYDILDSLRTGDLLIRDMGYFCLECFHRIAAKGAFFVTRLPEGTVVRDLA